MLFIKQILHSGVILLCTVDNLFQDFKIEGARITYVSKFISRKSKKI